MFLWKSRRSESKMKTQPEEHNREREATDVDSEQVSEDQVVIELRARIVLLEEQLEISEMNRKILKENFAMENDQKLKLMEEVAALKIELALYTSEATNMKNLDDGQDVVDTADLSQGETIVDVPPPKLSPVNEVVELEAVGTGDNTVNTDKEEPPVHISNLDETKPAEKADAIEELHMEEPVLAQAYPTIEQEVADARTFLEADAQTDPLQLTVKNSLGEDLSLAEAEALIQAQHGEILALSKELAKKQEEGAILSPANHRELIVSPRSDSSGCCLSSGLSKLFKKRNKKSSTRQETILS